MFRFGDKSRLFAGLLVLLLVSVIGVGSSGGQSVEASVEASVGEHSQSEGGPQPRYLCVHRSTTTIGPGVNWRSGNPSSINQAGIDEILDMVGTKGTADTKLALSFTISYLGEPMSISTQALRNLLTLSRENELPLVVHLDGVNYWRIRPDLWNWWDPSQPGYDPDNVFNVEWHDWGPEHAVKIGWRNWGSQHRVLPAPNLGSPQFRQAQKESLDVLIPMIVDWYRDLPDDRKFLLGGVVLGWEVTPYAQAYYYRDGNSYLDKNPAGDPDQGIKGSLPLGYAAATTLGLQDDGIITQETVDVVCRDYLEFVTKTAMENGLPGDKIVTHAIIGAATDIGGGHSGSGAMVKGVFESGVIPGWSFYGTRVDAIDGFLDQLCGRPWAAIEFQPSGLSERFIETYFDHRNCRYLNIFNWESVRFDHNALTAIRRILGMWDVGSEWLGWDRSAGSGQMGEFVAIDSSQRYVDFAFQLEVKHNRRNDLTGIFVRAQDEFNSYYLGLDSVGQRVVLSKVIDGTWTVLDEFDIDVEAGAWYALRVELHGSSIKGYLNRELVVRSTDSVYPYGMIGFRSTQSAAGMRNLSVERY